MAPMRALAAVVLAALCVVQADAFYDKNSNVVSLTPSNFRDKVVSSNSLWIVEFYAPWCGHCQSLKPEYEKAATNLKGIVSLGAVDCDDKSNGPLCQQYGIQGFPTIKVFDAGKSKPTDYPGARTARAIVDFATGRLPNKVVRVTGSSFDSFLANDAEKAHFAFFTSKTSTSAMLKSLAISFADVAVLGEIRSSEKALAERFGVSSFPALLGFAAGSSEPIAFVGKLNQDEIRAFMQKHSPARSGSSSAPPPEEPEEPEEPEYVEPVFDPEVAEVVSQADFKEACLDRPIGVCLIAFLDPQPEAESERAASIEILKTLKLKAFENGQSFHFMWVDGIKQESLRRAFDISDQLPGAVLISPGKGRFRPFLGGFDEEGLASFLQETVSGKGRTFKNPAKFGIV